MNAVLLRLLTLFEGVWFDAPHWVILPSLALALLNTFLPLLILLGGLPLNLPSLAVFSLLANAAVLLLVDYVLPAIHVTGLWTNVAAATILAAANYIMNWFLYHKEISYTASLQ